jgi:hypothetical protein
MHPRATIRASLPFLGCALAALAANAATTKPAPAPCDVAAASQWIDPWFSAWELTSREILRLPDAQPPQIVLYDSACVFTTSPVSVARAPSDQGPALRGARLPWRAALHGDSLTLPDAKRVPVQLMSFASSDQQTGPYFVMAAPSYWERTGRGQGAGLTAVFLHEFAHTRQIRGVARVIGPIDSTWNFERELDDDAVQHRFGSDSTYVAEYRAERDLFYRAAQADSLAEVRRLAVDALAMMRRRHAKWFRGDDAVFAKLDDTFLSLEGAGQWTGYAWLAHPKGGGLSRTAAIDRISGRRRWWAQDEGLGIFLVVDRLLPDWPSLVFHDPSAGVLALLERSTRR